MTSDASKSMKSPKPGRISDWASPTSLVFVITLVGFGWEARGDLEAQTARITYMGTELKEIQEKVTGLQEHVKALESIVQENRELRTEIKEMRKQQEAMKECLAKPRTCDRSQFQ